MTDPQLDTVPCGYFAFTEDGIVVRINETACTALGGSKSEFIGRSVETLFTVPTKIFFQTHLFPLVKMHGHAEEIYLDLKGRNGDVPVLLNATRTTNAEEHLIECAFIVVSNRKKFEEELILAKKAAEKATRENSELIKAKADLTEYAEKLEEQMQLIARHYHDMQELNHAVTHNLKEPLRKILMFAGKLDQSSPSPNMERLLRATGQMKNVVSALQEYVWLDEKEKKFFSLQLEEIIQEAAALAIKEAPAVSLNIEMEELPQITADADQLRLLFYQLISNAIKFRKSEQVEIIVRTTLLKKNLFRETPGKYSYQDFVRIEFEDRGVGFEPKYKVAVFELFRKLHFGESLGVGLSLAKKAVQNHNGFIEADSVPDAFTRIVVYLPLRQSVDGKLPAGSTQ